jgi:hypothetical protein
MEIDMTRSILLAGTALISVSISSLSAKAAEAPWCAAINEGTGSIYEDCQYSSFDDCYRRANILAGNRGFCNVSPYYATNAAEPSHPTKRRARLQ